MGIRIHKYFVALHSSTGQGLEPEYAGYTKEAIDEYLTEHPIPTDPNYSKDDLINDLTESTGTLTFPEDIKPETVAFLEEILNELWGKNNVRP